MHHIHILALGGFEAYIPSSRTTVRFPTRKAAALITFLAMQRNARASRQTIAELLWKSVPSAQARHSLRQTLVEIRRTLNAASADRLGDRLVATVEDDVALRTTGVFIDVHLFRRCLERQTPRGLRVACALYRGDFLTGLQVRETPFQFWAANQRNHLHVLAIGAHQRRVEQLMEERMWAAALETALRLRELDPLHEPAHHAVLTLYARRGDMAATKRHYDMRASVPR